MPQRTTLPPSGRSLGKAKKNKEKNIQEDPDTATSASEFSSRKKANTKHNSKAITDGDTAHSSDPPYSGTIFFWHEWGEPHCYLSQWYAAAFHTGDPQGLIYANAEQYMMHQKALLFSDHMTAELILRSPSPKTCKALGRQVTNFDALLWGQHRSRIVEEGSYYKFKYGIDHGEFSHSDGQKLTLKERLLGTGSNELVEASPHDEIWGIGFKASDAEGMREHWGMNLLGKALMAAREKLRAEEEEGVKRDAEPKEEDEEDGDESDEEHEEHEEESVESDPEDRKAKGKEGEM